MSLPAHQVRDHFVDSRARFRQIYCAIQADHGFAHPYDRPCSLALHRLSDEPVTSGKPVYLGPARQKLRIVIIPGIFGECVEGMALPFEDAVGPLRQIGWSVETLRVSGRSGSAANARQIADQLSALRLAPDEKLVMVGYSKGMSDILELIGSSEGTSIPNGSSIVSLAGVVRGTPIADSAAARAYGIVNWLPFPGCGPGDRMAVDSLTPTHRSTWLMSHELPPRLHYYSMCAFAALDDVSRALRPGWKALARMDTRNDGNVIASDSVIPGSQLLGYANADHWALALPLALKTPFRAKLFANRNEYPRVVLVVALETIVDGFGAAVIIRGIERVQGSDLHDELRGSGGAEEFSGGRWQ